MIFYGEQFPFNRADLTAFLAAHGIVVGDDLTSLGNAAMSYATARGYRDDASGRAALQDEIDVWKAKVYAAVSAPSAPPETPRWFPWLLVGAATLGVYALTR